MRGDPYHIRPYRIEWRSDLTTQWLLLQSCDIHGDALEVAERERERLGGQVRIVSQHVIGVNGLGADTFR